MTPNLRCLTIIGADFDDYDSEDDETDTVDFKLEQLRELDFRGEFVTLFCQICPNLQVLNQRMPPIFYKPNVIPLIRATQATLQKLSFDDTYMSPDNFRDICSLNQLYLVELSLTSNWQDPEKEQESYMSLISMQPSLEILRLESMGRSVDCGPQIWSTIKENFPYLKTLFLKIDVSHAAALPTFLSHLTQLECLEIEFSTGVDFNLGTISNPNLKSLKLHEVDLDPDDLSAFFAKTPNIRHLTVGFGSDDILRSISCLKQLEELEIGSCNISQSDYVMSSVKTLISTFSSTTSIKYAATVFPNTQHLTATGDLDTLRDVDVLILVRELKQLKTLNLPEHSDLTPVVLDHIVEHGHSLERLQLQLDRIDILPAQLAQLRKMVRVRVLDVSDQDSEDDLSTDTFDPEDLE